jgi:hypothetical protein
VHILCRMLVTIRQVLKEAQTKGETAKIYGDLNCPKDELFWVKALVISRIICNKAMNLLGLTYFCLLTRPYYSSCMYVCWHNSQVLTFSLHTVRTVKLIYSEKATKFVKFAHLVLMVMSKDRNRDFFKFCDLLRKPQLNWCCQLSFYYFYVVDPLFFI